MKKFSLIRLTILFVFVCSLLAAGLWGYRMINYHRTLSQVVSELRDRRGLGPYADATALTLVVNKSEAWLRVYNQSQDKIAEYSLTAQSGREGPKRQEGDRQIPEGIYRLDALNPQSAFHLSMRIAFPNELDRQHLGPNPGSDIYIHVALPLSAA